MALKSVLMFGGNSEERFVSVASAQNIARTMNDKSSTPFSEIWFVAVNGEVSRVSLETLSSHKDPFKTPFVPNEKPFAKSVEDAIPFLKNSAGDKTVVFLGFHGTFGEDGKVQAMLEKNKIPFTGSGSKASHMCFDKTLAKKIVSEKGIATAPGLLLTTGSGGNYATALPDFFKKHGKIVAKPVANGSSIGLHIIGDEKSLARAIDEIGKSEAFGHFLAEKFIVGRELTVGIIERGGKLVPLPPSEVLLNAGASFDYDGKYLGRGTTEITPAQITKDECEAAQKVALEAHRTLGCYGYSRTDVILRPEGVLLIETNTLPGLTKASFIPQQLEAAGMTVQEFISEQLELAFVRPT